MDRNRLLDRWSLNSFSATISSGLILTTPVNGFEEHVFQRLFLEPKLSHLQATSDDFVEDVIPDVRVRFDRHASIVIYRIHDVRISQRGHRAVHLYDNRKAPVLSHRVLDLVERALCHDLTSGDDTNVVTNVLDFVENVR